MPGTRLSAQEERLAERWAAPTGEGLPPTLRSLEIDGGSGLRGITGMLVPFRYPITAICGANGVGKSTVLALSALAFHSPDGWFVHRGQVPWRRQGQTRSSYTFPDFFVQGDGDGAINDVRITWRYEHQGIEQSLSFTKRPQRWGNYSDRPERALDFVPLGRLMPPHEIASLRSTFTTPDPGRESLSLSPQSRQHLSYIMGRDYTAADVQRSTKWRFPKCASGSTYTAFNMGGGENCVISLLHLLERLPRGGMLVVEEIEAALHPEAQTRLARTLVDLALAKVLQIVCTTHSEPFIDALPRQARLLLRRLGGEHSVYEAPSRRFAVREMSGDAQPELVIYCEDAAARLLIEEALPLEHRMRVQILDVGSDATVIRQGVSHLRSGYRMRALCILDGDQSEATVNGWIRSERAERHDLSPAFALLPGDGRAPENWVLEQLRLTAYESALAHQLNCNDLEARAHVEAMRVEPDHHSIAHRLSMRTGFDRGDCLRRIMRAVALRHPQLDGLRSAVGTALG